MEGGGKNEGMKDRGGGLSCCNGAIAFCEEFAHNRSLEIKLSQSEEKRERQNRPFLYAGAILIKCSCRRCNSKRWKNTVFLNPSDLYLSCMYLWYLWYNAFHASAD